MHKNCRFKIQQQVTGSAGRAVALIALVASLTAGCAMNQTQERTGTGAAVGALGGALLGTSRESAAIGAAVGAAGGYIYDQYNKREDAQSENAQLRSENEQLRQEAADNANDQ